MITDGRTRPAWTPTRPNAQLNRPSTDYATALASYALAFGHGWRMLDENAYEHEFGVRIALRSLQPDQIREVLRTELGTGARLDLTHVAGGTDVRAYGIEQAAEIVRKIGGRTNSLALTHLKGRRYVSLEGRHALKVPLTTSPEALINDLRAVQEAYDRQPVPELAFIEFLRPLSASSSRYKAASRALVDQLGQQASEFVGLTLPVGLLGHTIAGYRVELAGETFTLSDIDLAAIVGPLAAVPKKSRFEELTQGTIYAALDDGESEPIATHLTHWLAADLTVAEDRVVYQHGTFYEVTAAYRKMLRNEVERLMKPDSPWELPPWKAGVHEKKYNEVVGGRSGWVNLDRHLHRGPVHPKGIEICDLVAPDGALVCVKRADGSAVLSHLFNQAVVAAEALRDGNEARQWLHDRLPADRRDIVPRSPHFVFAIQLPRRLTPDSLFTFSRATLYRAAKHLERMGMAVSVVDIERGTRGRTARHTR